MKENSIFQTEYPQETIDDLLAWINSHPTGEVDLGNGIHIDDVSLFANNMQHILQYQSKNPCYAGQIETLIRAKMAWERKMKNGE